MNITDINLGFLWIEKTSFWLDAPDPFDEKWRDDYIKLSGFIEFEPLEKVIDLIILIYKDKYPKNSVFAGLSTSRSARYVYIEDGYDIIDGGNLSRTDITRYKDKTIFLMEWLSKKNKKENYFYLLYNKTNGENFVKYVKFLYTVWKESLFTNEKHESFTRHDGPLELPYKSDKFLGFYYSNTDIKFLENDTLKVTIEAKEKLDYNPYKIGAGHSKQEKDITYTYHPFQPIKLSNIIEESSIELPKIIPAFFLKANEDKAFWANVITAIEYTVDVATTVSGVGNIYKFRHLAKVAKVATRLNKGKKVVQYAKVASKIRLASGLIEISTGTVNAIIRLSGTDNKFALALQEYLYYLELVSLSGELTTALKKGLRKKAKKALHEKNAIKEVYKKIDSGDKKILEDLDVKNVDEAKSQINAVVDKLKKHADDVIEEVFDAQKVLNEYIAIRKDYLKRFPIKDKVALKNLNSKWIKNIKVRELKRNELLTLYNKYLKIHPELDGMNFGVFDIDIYKSGKIIEKVKEFSHSRLFKGKGKTKIADIIDGRTVIDKIDNRSFIKNIIDLENIKKVNDSEVKFLYNFINVHLSKGDYFVIKTQNIFTTCSSCRKEFLMFKELLGKNKVKILVEGKERVRGTEKLKDYLKIN